MKICVIASTYPRSEGDAAVPWLREELVRLKARGHDVRVYAPAFKGSRHHFVDGIPVHRFRYFFGFREDLTHDSGAPTRIRRPDYLLITVFYILFGALGLARLHRRERFDVLHVHWPFPHGLFSALATRMAPARVVMSFHGAELLLARKFGFVGPMLRRITRRADAVTANSSYTAAEIRRICGREAEIKPFGSPIPEDPQVTVIPSEAEGSVGSYAAVSGSSRSLDFTRDVTIAESNRRAVKTVLFVGRLIERKGVEYLLQAMPLVREQVAARLVIVGNGVLLEPLRARADELGLSDSVEFRVDIPEEALRDAYRESDVFVLPAIVDSRGDTEGLGVVLIEALSFRKPVVASEVGGIVDVIKQDETGLLVPEKDPRALSEALVRVLTDPVLAGRLGRDGYQHIRRFFDWDRIMDQSEAIYGRLLGAEREILERAA